MTTKFLKHILDEHSEFKQTFEQRQCSKGINIGKRDAHDHYDDNDEEYTEKNEYFTHGKKLNLENDINIEDDGNEYNEEYLVLQE